MAHKGVDLTLKGAELTQKCAELTQKCADLTHFQQESKVQNLHKKEANFPNIQKPLSSTKIMKLHLQSFKSFKEPCIGKLLISEIFFLFKKNIIHPCSLLHLST